MSLSLATRICAVGLLLFSAQPVKADPPLPVIPSRTTNVLSFGAFGNGVSNNAAAINAAITAINTAGGGTVEISPGSASLTNYLSGPITMKSKINLQIDSGTKLQMLPMSSWPNASTPFINAATITDVEVSGSGIIDGQGTNWWFPLASTRPNFLYFGHCTRVLVKDVTLQNPPTFTIYMKDSDISVTIDHITINTPYDSHNTDAFDISSTNVLIRNSFISTGDDDVEIGGSGAEATDITISNCTFGTGHGLSLGSKIGGGVNNLLVSNCWWNGTEYGIKIKSDRGSGGLVTNLRYLDLHMTNVNFPIAFYMYYLSMGSPSKNITNTPASAASDLPQSTNSSTPFYRNITISNLTAIGNSGIQGPGNIACIIYGEPESLVSNVTLSQVNILGRGSDGTFSIFNARAIRIIDSNLTTPLAGTNVLTLYNAQVTVTNSAANTNPVTLGGLAAPGTNALSFFNAQAAITDTNLDGTAGNAGPFTLGGSTLTFNQSAVSFTNNLSVVSASTLAFTGGSNTFTGAFSGTGALTFNLPGSSVLTLRGNSSGYSGSVAASNGTLMVNNTTGSGTGTGTLTVLAVATLGGTGVLTGPVIVNGTLAPGTSPGTLTISNNLVLNSSAVLQYQLGTSSDLTKVSGNLTLDGTINITNAGGFTNSTYTLFTYGGTLTNNVLTIGTTPNPSFTYTISTNTPNQVNLVVTGAGGPPLVAGFSGSPTNGTAPLAVTFTDTSTGTISNWFWNFGDGNTTNFAVQTNPVHTYSAGTYTVSLTVSGSGGTNTSTQSNYIVATNPPPPVASFSGSPTNGAAPLATTFTDSSTGSISNRFWNFGDGNTTNFVVSTNPLHTYNAGAYTVSLTVSGLGGTNTSTRTSYIVALNPAHLVINPSSLGFGSVTIGQTNSLNFSVINTGDVSLNGTATSAAPFVVTSGSPYNNVAGGQTATVTVAFAPGSAAPFNGSVIFTSTGGNSTNNVSGVGLTPGSIAVTPATLDFGTLATGTTAQASFVVTNSGGTAVTNGTATASGGPFTILSGATFSVPGFGTSNVLVRFAPVSAGGFTNSVVFATANGGTTTNTVIGAGAILPVADFSASPTNGTAPLLVSFTDNSSGTIASNFWDFGDGNTTNFTAPTNVTHTYQTNGIYTVTLIASGPNGVDTNAQVGLIMVLDQFQAWQMQFFGCTICPQADPNADPDGDGMSNTAEFLASTDPTNSTSALRITGVARTNDDLLVSWMMGPGTTNALQSTPGAVDGSYETNAFADIFTVTNTVGTITNYLDIGAATNAPSLYYRVRLVP